MSRNAVAAFCGLGFTEDQLLSLGFQTRAAGTWTSTGQPILTIPDSSSTTTNISLIGIHRGRLHAALLQRCRDLDVEIVTGTPVNSVEPGEPDGALAVVAGRTADLVVGADGMRSALRNVLSPQSRTLYSGYSSWRAIIPRLPGETTLQQFWGPHAEFGVMPVSEEQTYWYGYIKLPEGTTFPDELAAARKRFAGWAPSVQGLLDRTDPSALMRHDVHRLPGGLPSYASGRVVMIGDAAHGFLPTMGQGAATALEDGLCVGLLVGHPVAAGGSLRLALDQFDRERRQLCRTLGRAAFMSGQAGAHLGGGWLQTVRNSLMRLTPASLVSRGADAAMGWTPPAPAAPRN
jgi:2-polyprenyl-6-methoxyphenol hydroxylase-like FAD-dependent oxidoreductase